MGYGGVSVPALLDVAVNGQTLRKVGGKVDIELDQRLEEQGLINISVSELETMWDKVFDPTVESGSTGTVGGG